MVDNNSKNIGYSSQLGILLGLTGTGLIISLVLSFLIWLMMTGVGFPSKIEEVLQPKYNNANMVIQAVSTFFIFFVPVYFFARICYRNANKFLGFNLCVNYKQFFLMIGILVFTFPLSGLLAELTELIPMPQSWIIKFRAMETARDAEIAPFININSFVKYLVSLFILALLPAIFEETFFRGGMQGLFTRWFNSPWIAIIVTSIIFSAIHYSFYGFFVRAGLGVVLGFIYYYSGSLSLNIVLHFLYNGLQVTALYLASGPGNRQPKDLEKNFPIWVGVIAFILLLYLFKEYKRISVIQRERYVEKKIPENDFPDWDTN